MPNDEKAWEPTWLYCLKNNKPVSQLFLEPPENPDEWHDEPQTPRGPGRPKKEVVDEPETEGASGK